MYKIKITRVHVKIDNFAYFNFIYSCVEYVIHVLEGEFIVIIILLFIRFRIRCHNTFVMTLQHVAWTIYQEFCTSFFF
jgi:hypothetical protein